MLTVLGSLAEFERALIRARIGEGWSRAKARGVKMGRPPKMTPHQVKEALSRRDAGEPMRDIARLYIARLYNVSHSTISRLTPRIVQRDQQLREDHVSQRIAVTWRTQHARF
jgi:DNA invertase Pin-like site-specific DNA recombinase